MVVSPKPGQSMMHSALPAEIKPWVEAPIYARISGYLKQRYVDIGDAVEAGRLLATIDTPEQLQELERARGQRDQAEAALGISRITAVRWAELLTTASVSEQDAAEKQADFKLKTALVASATAEVRRLEKIQEFTKVTAPFSGIFSGCAVGPDYQRPEAGRIPEAYVGPGKDRKIAAPCAHIPKGDWWEIFEDAELNQLEAETMAANQDLKMAVARFAQARAVANVAESALFPRLGFSAVQVDQRDSKHRPVGGKPDQTYDTLTVPFDFSYEIDIWGRVKRSVELARNRRAAGMVSDLNVAQAETVLKNALAQTPDIAMQRIKYQNALAVLTGSTASLFQLPERPLLMTPVVVPAGLPSELLERRPDIAKPSSRLLQKWKTIYLPSSFWPMNIRRYWMPCSLCAGNWKLPTTDTAPALQPIWR
jgi:biotin carboxyl carrier protein